MKGQNIGGKKSLQFHINPVWIQTLLVEKWRTKPDNTDNESTNYREKDLFTAYLLQYIWSTTMTMAGFEPAIPTLGVWCPIH